MNTIQSEKVGPFTVRIEYDQDVEYPYHSEDNWGHFITFERSSTLTDKHPFTTPEDALTFAKQSGWHMFPLFKFEHGSVMYRIGAANPFSCPWDSGQVGIVLVNPEECPRPEDFARGVCETITAWCNGSVYGFIVEDRDGNHIDSCWGFYGLDEAVSEGRDMAQHCFKDYLNQKSANMVALAKFAMFSQ